MTSIKSDTNLQSPPQTEKPGWVKTASILTIAIGLVVLCGWTFGIEALKRVLPGLVTMKANTAAAFALSGICLYLQTLPTASPALLLIRRIAAALVLLLGLVTLCEYRFGWDAGIDQLLFGEPPGEILTSHPGRMSTITATNFALTGGALLLIETRLWVIAQAAALAVAMFALMPLSGYVFGNLALTHVGDTTAIAAHTVTAFLILAAGVLAATQNHGLMVWLRRKSQAIGLATSLIMLVFIFGAATYNFVQKDKASQWVEHTYKALQSMESYSDSMHDFLYHSRGFLITGDDRHLIEGDKRHEAMTAEFAKMHQLVSDKPVQRERLDALGKLARQRIEQANLAVLLWREKSPKAAAAMIFSGQGEALTGEFDAKLDELRETERSLLKERQRIAEIIRASSLFNLAVLLAASMLLLLWVFRASQREIIERRQAEEYLRNSEHRLKEAQRIAHIGDWNLDLAGNVLTWSDEIYRLFELDPEKFRPSYENFLEVIHPDDREWVNKIYTESVSSKTPYDIEHRLLMKDGRVKYVNERCETYYGRDGKPLRSFGTVHDITERKQMEEKLAQREALFRNYFDLGQIGMAITSLEKGWLRVNDRLCEMLGYTREELAEMTWVEMTHPDDLEPDLVQFRKLLSGEIERYSMDKRFIRKDGSIVHTYLAVSCQRKPDGAVDYVIASLQDITERKLAEKELREKEERLALATLQNGVGVWDWNLVTQEMIWDDSMYALYHIRREDFTGTEEAWRAALHPDDLERGDREVNDAIAGIKPFDTEFRVVWPNGEIHHIKAVAKVFHDAQGTPLRMLGINMDITELRQTSIALQEKTSLLRNIIDSSADYIFAKDRELRTILCNEIFARTVGKNVQDLIGKTDIENGWDPVLVKGDAAKGIRGYEQDDLDAVAGKTVHSIDQVYVDSELHYVDTVKQPLRDEAGHTLGMFGISRDITASKLRDNIQTARLRLTDYAANHTLKELLVATLDEACALTGSSIGFYHFLDADQQTLSLQAWSTRTTREFCKAEGEGAHYNISDAGVWVDCVRERRPVIHNDYAALPNKRGMPPGHAHVEREMVVPIFRNELIVAILGVGNKAVPYKDSDLNSVTQLADLAWDIAVARRAEEEVRRLNAELEQRVVERTAQLEAANKDMEGFSYSVSHDLRSPLRAIDGFSRILLEDYAARLDDEGKRLLHVVGDNAQKMGELIDDILAFSRTTRQEVTRSEIDMAGLVREIMDELKPETAGRELKLELQALPPARADRSMLHQVLLNLLGNAVKFTRHKTPALIEVGTHGEGNEIVYYVKDNGVGFDMQYVGKLFGVFHRLHGQTEFEGTGIGLAIVKRIITKHGGRVWAEGRLNEGATVYFTLPVKED